MIGANGVLNRLAEDRVLTDWFRKPHKRYGTSSRLINVIAGMQFLTILMSLGDVYTLGEAYAFGVVWSFFLKSLGVLVLRSKRHDQEYKFPVNPRILGREIPVGLATTTLILGLVAIANLFSKRIATIYGVGFTICLFVIFTVSEYVNKRRQQSGKSGLEEFNLEMQPEVTAETVHARPGCVLVAVRDYNHMAHLRSVLEKTNLRRHDIVVMTVRPVSSGAAEYELSDNQLFSDYEKELLTRVVTLAEKEGKTVDLIVVPGVDPFDAMVQTASRLKASRLVTGVSAQMDSDELARRIGLAWERLAEPRHPFSLEIITSGRPSVYVNLGPHPPRLWPEDLDRAHDLWLRLQENFGHRIHHRDVVGVALRRLEKDLESDRKGEVIEDLGKELHKP
jgi:nucleotide-binding universal stress UspA family protein